MLSSDQLPHVSSSATDICFARQHNILDNNNQCFSTPNGHLPNHLAAQRPGAIDNQPLVTTEPMKVCVLHVVILMHVKPLFTRHKRDVWLLTYNQVIRFNNIKN